jgi:hypothetical protein
MENNEMELLPGLYGSSITKNRAVGFCHFHKSALTVKTMKCHECLKKQCDALERYVEHDFWRQHEQKKELRKAKKQTFAALIG